MRAVPISRDVAAQHPGMRRVVLSAPSGNLIADGSSPDQAVAVDALMGLENGHFFFVERMVPEPGELEALQQGGQLEVRFYGTRMPVHSIIVWPPDGRRYPIMLPKLLEALEDVDADLLMANPVLDGDPAAWWDCARGKLKNIVEILRESAR